MNNIVTWLHSHAAGWTGTGLAVLSTLGSTPFIDALKPLLGSGAQSVYVVHGLILLGVVLALNGRGPLSKAQP